MDLILASASPRRQALLDQIGVTHRALPVDIDERLLTALSAGLPDQAAAIAAPLILKSQTSGRWSEK